MYIHIQTRASTFRNDSHNCLIFLHIDFYVTPAGDTEIITDLLCDTFSLLLIYPSFIPCSIKLNHDPSLRLYTARPLTSYNSIIYVASFKAFVYILLSIHCQSSHYFILLLMHVLFPVIFFYILTIYKE